MPLNKRNTRTFHRRLYAGQLESVTLLKREDGMQAATVTSLRLFEVRWSMITKQGEQLDGDVQSEHRRELHIPRSELDRVGVAHINPLYRFIDDQGRYWMPEATDMLTSKLWENHLCVPCQRTDPIPTPGV